MNQLENAPAESQTNTPRPIVILGPTAGGKSELAVRLAEWFGEQTGNPPAQIIGADSMQVYRHMDAGTAKASPDQRARAEHHLIDFIEPTDRFTVSDWVALADAKIAQLQQQGVRPIVAGGTNLYINALLKGLFDGPAKDEDLRKELMSVSPQELHVRLTGVDPVAAQRIHPNDQKRLVRAIEVYELTGKPISEHQTQWREDSSGSDKLREENDDAAPPGVNSSYRHNPILIGMNWLAEEINPRINLRVKAMFYPDKVDPAIAGEVTPTGESLPDETKRLEAAGLLGEQSREALGYKQVLDFIAGECPLDDAFERTKILTRRFAKQQRTWLKRFRNVCWFDAADLDDGQRLDAAIEAL